MSRTGTLVFLGFLLSSVASPAAETQLTSGGSDQRAAWSPDNTTIVFDSNRSGDRELWSIPAGGGVATRLTTNAGNDWDPDWSPSSTTIVYSRVNDLYTIPAGGGTPVLLVSNATADRFPSWSPDSTRIAYSNGDIWIVPAAGGTPVQLTTDPALDNHPTWSPDGSLVAFQSNRSDNNDIWVIPAAGGTAVQVTTHTGSDAAADWSPDGTRIAFQSNRSGNNDIWVIGAGGGTAAQITVTAGNDVQPDWGPNGEIVFSRGGNLWRFTFPRSDLAITKNVDEPAPFEGDAVVCTVAVVNDGPEDATHVVVMDLLPAGVTYQSHTVTRGTYAPLTGKWDVEDMVVSQADTLTITATVDDGTAGATIVNTAVVGSVRNDDPDPSNDESAADVVVQIQLEVTEKPLTVNGTDRNPAWSPDGRIIAFDSQRSGKQALWTVPATGGAPVPLSSTLASSRQPDWSPTSREIAFSGDGGSRRGGADFDLYTLVTSGAGGPGAHGELTRLRSDPGQDVSPAWSPDGTTIAYSNGSDIWVVASTGGAPTQLTTDVATDAHPTWSPDGTMIAFVSGRSGTDDLWVIPAAGGAATQITTGPASDMAPDWSPLGDWIAFHSDRAGSDDIWIVPPGGGQPSRITPDPGADTQPDWAPNGRQLVFSRGGGLWVATVTNLPSPEPNVTAVDEIRPLQLGRIESVGPNPGRSPRIRWDLRRSGVVNLAIYDLSGRLVKELVAGERSLGPHVTNWNGRDRAGRAVPSGVYFARLETGGWSESAKIVVVR
jgi:uncharacterized repeat protein (TIGR01451 family)